MRELGPEAPRLHRETGVALRSTGLRRLWAYGDFAPELAEGFGRGAQAFPDFDTLAASGDGLDALPVGARILVKGSRFWRSERAVAWILDRFDPLRS
ncbi:MAG: putative bifunctional UDP-N-acetylmuramoylalanyl-D-glutamate--2,6-diaminopimelate ligase/UDP-N-acetylmuramoyl-tripeptide:D-alanyl-D-alanine ligase [Acidobacteria bacterium ADurb.Bin340]|nr:MAG: putative bifunctional UDP-N-acetylmuramoylalanyl-D-glutamate--2,6-diaminopimelate ligase/UDP-N-acetylmuramoyl-tripeptide:D-alanyl-D-alanine ligase [Acidobacteria bacterium ADurb.Bin340]